MTVLHTKCYQPWNSYYQQITESGHGYGLLEQKLPATINSTPSQFIQQQQTMELPDDNTIPQRNQVSTFINGVILQSSCLPPSQFPMIQWVTIRNVFSGHFYYRNPDTDMDTPLNIHHAPIHPGGTPPPQLGQHHCYWTDRQPRIFFTIKGSSSLTTSSHNYGEGGRTPI